MMAAPTMAAMPPPAMAAPRMMAEGASFGASAQMMGGPPMAKSMAPPGGRGGPGGPGGPKMRRAAKSAAPTSASVPSPSPAVAPAPATDSASVYGADEEGTQVDGEPVDLTQIPKQLDAQFEALDEDSSLRPTVIKTGMYSRVFVACRLPFLVLW